MQIMSDYHKSNKKYWKTEFELEFINQTRNFGKLFNISRVKL